jgi:peptidoglycan hydrolase CwlO-like protein
MDQGKKDNILFLVVLVAALSFSFLLFQNVAWGQDNGASTTTPDNSAQVDKTQKSIKDIQKKIDSQEKEKTQLEQELAQIQKSVNTSRSDIARTQALIAQVEESISQKESEIDNLNSKIQFQKEALKLLIQEAYYAKQESLVDFILKEDDLLSAWTKIDDVISLNQKITDLINDINDSKNNIREDRQNLLQSKSDHEKLLTMKSAQQKVLVSDKIETQDEIAEKEATIQELQDKLSKLQSNLSGFLGKSYNTQDIEDAAKFASKAAGVRKDFLMGMLTVESDLGNFTGGCYAKDSRMSGNRLTLFKKIADELNYDWKKRKVSCPPKNYKGTGGAMGVAQFMSDTWMGYKSSISSNTGHNPPDPWNLTDGVMAMALKLARGGATSKSGECNAAKLYLSGTTSSKYQWYCKQALYWADNYEKKLNN